jgi:transcriptional regulator with PAS, ATPase and Fis domain
MEHAMILAGAESITVDHLPAQLTRTKPAATHDAVFPTVGDKTMTLHELELQYIVRVLEQNNHNKPETAKQLGISLKTLYNKLNKYEEEHRAAG